MSQPQTITSLANVPMSITARQQFQQYLSRASTLTSGSSSTARPAPSDLDALLRRSAHLTSRVDELHAQLCSGNTASSDRTDDPQLFWSTLTLLTNLRDLSAQLRSISSDRKANDALTRTEQNVGIVESLLRLLSISNSNSADAAGHMFTAPIRSNSTVTTSLTHATPAVPERKSYDYWKRQTLSALDSNNHSTSSLPNDEEEEAAISDTESVLTDPEIHLAAPTIPLAGLKRINNFNEDEEDLSEYGRAPPSSKSPIESNSHTETAPISSTAPTASDTILQSDRATHEALSSELLRMASILKSNSLAFADSLERDRLLLEKAGTDLGQNLDLMTRTRGRLGVYSKKARSMGWFTLSAIAIVIVSWMLMFLLIRLT
ncbi:uncharacterized protein UTRI_06357 [Ustilago trichophora]|uniref:Uncharacterized protein n=1 Tax=Ustilago trichophora TaxID=86804 RepID=A0A5C3EL17_9BASI|nr:uncharacterized protein UTRI_06357 [Ustilago trichophora]